MTHQEKIEAMKNKLQALKKGAQRLEKTNEQLLKDNKQQKRAGMILGLQNEMEKQDMVIEVLREQLANEMLFNSQLEAKLDEGPRRVRPPTREELYIQLDLVENRYKELERKYLDLVPARDPEKYRNKEVQTEEEWLDISVSEVSLGEIQNRRSAAEEKAHAQLKELQRTLKIQVNAIKQMKDLIASKGSSFNKLANIKDDYEDMLMDIEAKEAQLEKLRLQNIETQQRVDSVNDATNSTSETLKAQIVALEEKLNAISAANSDFESTKKGFEGEINDINNDNTFQILCEQIGSFKNQLKDVEGRLQIQADQQAQFDEEKVTFEENANILKDKIADIKADRQVEIDAANNEYGDTVQNAEELEYMVNEKKDLVKKARAKEVSLLEEVESLEKELRHKEIKSNCLNLMNDNPGDFMDREKMIRKFREEYEWRLNEKLKENALLKAQVRDSEDLLHLMKALPGEGNDYSVNSGLESIDTFEVYQPM